MNAKRIKAELKAIFNNSHQGNFQNPIGDVSNELIFCNEDKSTPTCILVHSWLGSKTEMVLIQNSLSRNGYNSISIQLKGHDSNPENLIHYTLEDWVEQLDHTVQYCVNKGFKNLFLFGHCGGGSIILNYMGSQKNEIKYIKGLFLASVPYHYNSKEVTLFAKLFNLAYRFIFKNLKAIIPPYRFVSTMVTCEIEQNPKVPHHGYNECFPLYATGEGTEMLRKCSKVKLEKISCPVAVFHYVNDHYYSLKHPISIFERINRKKGNKLYLLEPKFRGPIGGHQIFNNITLAPFIEEKTTEFIEKNSHSNIVEKQSVTYGS